MIESSAGRIDIGISEGDRATIVEGLSRLLADTYTLYLTTHNFHWNVTGPMFSTLHGMFMLQYTELWNAVDLIAERIRSLGYKAPGSYAQFSDLTSIKDAPAQPPKALDMVAILVSGHEAVARTARQKASGDSSSPPRSRNNCAASSDCSRSRICTSCARLSGPEAAKNRFSRTGSSIGRGGQAGGAEIIPY